jgi:hypothetical protein
MSAIQTWTMNGPTERVTPMTARSTAILLSLALVGFGSAAQGATLRGDFSGTDLSLQAGDTSTFTLGLDLSREGPYSQAQFMGGKVTIFSGDGDKQTFRIKKGDTTQAFTASFLYEEGGDYAASYRVKARYTERGRRIVDLNDWRTICEILLNRGREALNGQLGLQVADAGGEFPTGGGPPPGGGEPPPIFGGPFPQPPGGGLVPETPGGPGVPGEPLPAVPIPGALPLFASVLGIGGWLGYRRKQAQRAAAAA